jgi:sugar/nucleoside kinase (ribokinase family)
MLYRSDRERLEGRSRRMGGRRGVSAAYDLLVVGRPSVDLIFSGLESWPEVGRDVVAGGFDVCAGTSFNTPAAANRLGLRVGYVAMIGNDPWSAAIRGEFEAEGIPTDLLDEVDRPLPFVSVALNHDRDRGFVTYALGRDEDTRELWGAAMEAVRTADTHHVHAYAGEAPADLSVAARARGMTVSMDAWSGRWWEHPAPLEDIASRADVFLANEPEATAMTGEPDVRRAIGRMAELCPVVVIKRGARGAMAASDGRVVERPAEPAEVVDATGAGDCFNAGFLLGWLGGLDIGDCLTLGNVCGAGAVEAHGGYRGCPRREEILRIAASRGIALP